MVIHDEPRDRNIPVLAVNLNYVTAVLKPSFHLQYLQHLIPATLQRHPFLWPLHHMYELGDNTTYQERLNFLSSQK